MTNERRNIVKTGSDVIHFSKWLTLLYGNVIHYTKWLTCQHSFVIHDAAWFQHVTNAITMRLNG